MFPPRTPERNATNPPQPLQQLGFSKDDALTYTFSNMELPWVLIVHFSFFYRHCNYLLHIS